MSLFPKYWKRFIFSELSTFFCNLFPLISFTKNVYRCSIEKLRFLFKMVFIANGSSDINWQKRNLKPQPLSSQTNTQPFSQTGLEWLSCVASTYLYGAFNCMLLSCHVRVLEWIFSVVCPNVKELFAWSRRRIWSFKWQQGQFG